MTHTAHSLQKAFRYLFPDEVDELQRLANTLPPNPVVVNIGAGAGTSGLTFLESRPDLYLITIDITKDPSPLGCLSGEELILRQSGYWNQNRNTQIQGDSKVVGEHWKRGKVDMVFVDGAHEYEQCYADISVWSLNIKSDGLIAIHDYKKDDVFSRGDLPENVPHPKAWLGVDKAVNFLCIDKLKLEQVSLVDSLITFRIK